MFDGIFSDNLIDEITFNLPDELTVVNYSVADFTGDGYLDVGIVYKDKTCAARTFKVILLENIENRSFKKVLELDANWRDTPFDVGFAVEKNNINIVFRRNKNWIFAIYTMDNNKLKLLREEIYWVFHITLSYNAVQSFFQMAGFFLNYITLPGKTFPFLWQILQHFEIDFIIFDYFCFGTEVAIMEGNRNIKNKNNKNKEIINELSKI